MTRGSDQHQYLSSEAATVLPKAWFRTWPVHVMVGILVLLQFVALQPASKAVTWIFSIWLVAFLADNAAYFHTLRGFGRLPEASLQANRWLRVIRLNSAGAGILWGALPLLLFARLEGPAQQFLTLTILTSTLLTATQVLVDRNALLAFLLPSLGGLLLAWLAWGIEEPLLHAGLISGTLGISILLGQYRLREFASHRHILREKIALAEQLHQKNILLEDSNQSRTRILAVASHDLRQPAHALGLMLERLRTDAASAPCRDQVEMITGAVQNLSHSLEKLLDIARLDAGGMQQKPRDFDLRHLIDQLAAEFQAEAQQKRLRLHFDCPSVIVHSDEALLQSVLANLLSNAIRYTDAGSVSVQVLSDNEQASTARIEVRDTGRGIPKKHLQDIFEEYVRLNPRANRERGLGIGLAIVKRTAAILGCTIEVESEVNRGSIFSVTVPKSQSNRLPQGPALTRSQFTLLGCRGVIVDNDTYVLHSMEAMLTAWGCDLVTAWGCEDLERKITSLSRPIDFVMVDFHLGEDRTGLDAIRMVRKAQDRLVPAIILTGDVEIHLDSPLNELNLEIVHKPISPGRLRTIIEAAVLTKPNA